MKRSERSKCIGKLDKLWSLAIRSRDKVCRKCKKAPASQAAHIFTRNNMSTRWEGENGLGMCYYDHIIWAHRQPIEFTLWVEEELGKQKFKALRKRTLALEVFAARDYERKKKEIKAIT